MASNILFFCLCFVLVSYPELLNNEVMPTSFFCGVKLQWRVVHKQVEILISRRDRDSSLLLFSVLYFT